MSRFYNTRTDRRGTYPHMADAKTYEGTCHCGAVRFEVNMPPPEKAFTCNCSICSRAGWLLAFTPASTFRLLSGEESLTDYQFGKKNTHHVFCKTCGIRAFSRGKGHDGTPWIAANLRCFAGFDPTPLPVEQFDGASL
jgi:hypothetical protein